MRLEGINPLFQESYTLFLTELKNSKLPDPYFDNFDSTESATSLSDNNTPVILTTYMLIIYSFAPLALYLGAHTLSIS